MHTLDQEKLLPEEQKGCRKDSRETNDLLYIDRAVIKKVKSRNKNLAMAWIDYKAYDMVPHSWIIECLDLFRVAENIKSLLVNSMEKWKVMLCSVNSECNLNDEHRKIVERLDEIMLEGKTIDGIMFKKVDKKTLKVQTDRVNDAIKYFKSKKITETNDLIKAESV